MIRCGIRGQLARVRGANSEGVGYRFGSVGFRKLTTQDLLCRV